jgi:hypothetical protein
MKRKRLIAFETERIVIRAEHELGRCRRCEEASPLVSAEHAAFLTGEPPEQLSVRAALQQLHSIRTPDGTLMFCLRSLSEHLATDCQTAQPDPSRPIEIGKIP